ncbi:hypothetical protein NTGBS_1050016 [Candidatus Nitrotoga sp. BS]|nr:hypothetical protein NTGBS_1050016 [Candidatus Nitrotoga sp. BS]
MAQNEVRAKPALPERVRSMEGLGICARIYAFFATAFAAMFMNNARFRS